MGVVRYLQADGSSVPAHAVDRDLTAEERLAGRKLRGMHADVWADPERLVRYLSRCPDRARPGDYYVVGDNGRRFALLLGPFRNDAASAIARVADVAEKMCELDAAGELGWGIGPLELITYGLWRLDAGSDPPLGQLNGLGHVRL